MSLDMNSARTLPSSIGSLLRCFGVLVSLLCLVARVWLRLHLLDWRLDVGESLLVVAVRERDTVDWSRDGRRCS